MYSIEISDETHNIIDNFIIWYRKIFLELFDDTWIENEELIREAYIRTSKEFKNQIYKNINLVLQEDIILWKSPKENWVFMLTIPINNFRLFVYYKENIKIKERYIEEVEFFKK